MRVTRLQGKRDKLEAASGRILAELGSSMSENSYSSNMMSDIDFLFPEPVSKAFDVMMSDKDKDGLKKKHYFYDIARAMKKVLKDIDDQIDKEVLGKKTA